MNVTNAAELKAARYVATLQARNAAAEAQSERPTDRADAEGDEGVAVAEALGPNGADETTLCGLIELLLKDQTRFDHLARDPHVQRELVPRLLTIGLIGYVVFGVVLSIIFSAAGVWPEPSSVAAWLSGGEQPLIQFEPLGSATWQKWLDGSAVALVAAFVCGLLGANGICLPSFYFYNLLSGVRTSMLQVTVIALKGMAAGAIAVVGALPIYFALVLGLLVLPDTSGFVDLILGLGLILPFIAGFWGTRSLYRGFMALAETMPAACRHHRECFLRRLVFAWSACFTAVTPLMIFTLWEFFER